MQKGRFETLTLIRWIVFGLSSLVLLGMLTNFRTLPEWLSNYFGTPADRQTNLAIRELDSRDPALATKLREVKDPRDRRAIESLLRAEDTRRGSNVLLAEGIARQDRGYNAWREVARTAYNPELSSTPDERKEFIFAHGMVLDSLQGIRQSTKSNTNSGSKKEVDSVVDEALEVAYQDFLKDLGELEANPKVYRPVARDPIGVMLFNETEDKAIRSFYVEQTSSATEQDWLQEVIAQCVRPPTSNIEEDSNESSPGVTVGDVVLTAYRFHPIFKEMILDDARLKEVDRRPTPVILAIFQEYGDFVKIATSKEFDVARSDILDVIFANTDYLDRWVETNGSSRDSWGKLAAHFSKLQRSKPDVWREARYSPLALRLNDEAPEFANKVLEKYGQDDVATLIFSGYEQEVLQATAAIAVFEDLAIYILQKYADEPEESDRLFHKALKDPRCGIRVIPYIAMRDDQGLTELDANIKWADKYFDEEGKPRSSDWYEAVPFIGAPAKIVSNLKSGRPNSWEELGWAAFDVADVGITLATFGLGSVVAKTTKEAGKRTIVTFGRKATMSTVKRFANREAAKQARKKVGETLLRKVIVIPKLKGDFTPSARRIWNVLSIARKGVEFGYVKSIQTAKAIRNGWGSLPPSLRKGASRGVMAALIYVRLAYRSVPVVAQSTGLSPPDFGKFFKDPSEAFSTILSSVINQLQSVGVSLFGWACYLAVCAVLSFIVWRARPWGRRKLNYA